MSQGNVIHQRLTEKDFNVSTPEEFVKRFKGTRVINKVRIHEFLIIHINNSQYLVNILIILTKILLNFI